jgi:ATP-dependent DNA helicase RecG
LYGQLLPETFVPSPKNPHIAQLFTQMGRSEELGTGLRNVYKYSKAYSGSDDILFNEEDVFTVEVPLDNDTLNERQKHILQLIQQDEKITNQLIAKTLNISIETSKRELSKLTKMNMILHCGSRKTGHWEITGQTGHRDR